MRYRPRSSATLHCLPRLGIAAVIALSGCANAPVSIRDCTVRAAGSRVAFGVDVRSNMSRNVQKVYVLVSTAGLRPTGGGFGGGGSLIEYAMDGPFPSDQWVHREVLKGVTAEFPSIDQHLGAVSSCAVHAVEYTDGSHWFGGSPM